MKFAKQSLGSCQSIVGSVVECSPATRAARVRFPDDAGPFAFCATCCKCKEK